MAVYEAGETQYLDILLKSKNLTDFISSYYIITELAQIDEDLLSELEDKKKTIDISKQKLEKEKKELAVITENQTRVARTLQNFLMKKKNYKIKLMKLIYNMKK